MGSPALTADFFAELRAARRTADRIPAEFRPQDMASAYAIHGASIPGTASDAWHTLDLATHTVRLLVNRTVIRTGRGDGERIAHSSNSRKE